MKKTDILIAGAGPAGLGAAIEAARAGAEVVLTDENPEAGGQLYKQIHKFFGSQAHYAGVRGFEIADILQDEARTLGVEILLNTRVNGLLDDGTVVLQQDGRLVPLRAEKVVLSTGAKEKGLAFPGWTLPGVMTAGAGQTFANIHRILPGRKILVVGSGNVGLIVSYQLIQAGAEIAGIVEAKPEVSGYAVHAGKIKREGVPLFLGSTIIEARGEKRVEEAVISPIDENFNPQPGKEQTIAVDTILLSVGLSPRIEIASRFRCGMTVNNKLGGTFPLHDTAMLSTNEKVYVCGDLTGIEEANTALDEGRLAGLSAALSCGFHSPETEKRAAELTESLKALRNGSRDLHRREGKAKILKEREAVHV